MDRLAAAVLIVVLAVTLNGGMAGGAWAKPLNSGLGFSGAATVMTATSALRGLSPDPAAAESAAASSLMADGAGTTGSADAATLGASQRS